jgi:hypothetical protein
MRPTAPEPDAGPWTPRAFGGLVAELLSLLPAHPAGPAVLAVDGRSASGKSTLAERIAASVPGSCVVHTDDVAWWESFFGWDRLLAEGVLAPARRGQAVAFRPPAWDARGRVGAVEVPAGTALVVVEGVGASRRSLLGLVDASVWVQCDEAEARRRGVERDGGDAAAEAFWDEWDAEEVPFLADDRPWERAAAVVCGTPPLAGVPHDPVTEVLVGHTLRPRDRPMRR